MQTWKAVILLTAARHGLSPEAVEPLFPMLEARSKQILRSMGATHEEIEDEYPEETFDAIIDLLKSNPAEFNRAMLESSMLLCSRN